MSNIFKPHRGSKSNMNSSTLVLPKGELFLEYPDTGIGTGSSNIKIGDGTSKYSNLPYALGSYAERGNSENLFLNSNYNDRSMRPNNYTTSFKDTLRYYNGSASYYSFSEYKDGIYMATTTLGAGGNLGICFVRLADEIDLDSSSYYKISCWAKCSVSGVSLCFGQSYYSNSSSWVWRGGGNPKSFSATDTWQYFSWYIIPDADTYAICYCFTVNTSTAGTFDIRNCRMEKTADYIDYGDEG